MDIPFPDLFALLSRTVDQWGYWVVFLLVFLETSAFVGLLVPGETILIASGAIAAQGQLDLYDLMGLAVIAAYLGDNTGYWLGRVLGRDFLIRHRSITRVKESHLERADRYFERFGGMTIFLGRWLGFIRTFGPFLAGSSRMPYPKFLVYSLGGGASWAVVGILAGFLFGKSYGLIERWLGRISLFLLISGVVAVLLWLLARYLKRRRESLVHLANHVTDAVLGSRPATAIQRRFNPELRWVFRRFSPSRAYGLGLTVGMLVSVLLAWALGVLVNVVLERGPLLAIDRTVLVAVNERAIPEMTEAMIWVSHLGRPLWVMLAAVFLAGVLWFMRRRPEALALVTATGGAAFLMTVLKAIIRRPRPELVDPLVNAGGYAFPSGHAAAATAFYVTLAVLATGWVRHWESRVYVLVAAVGFALLVGFTRVYLGVHYPSDVVAGYAVGALWTTLSVTAATVWSRARLRGDTKAKARRQPLSGKGKTSDQNGA